MLARMTNRSIAILIFIASCVATSTSLRVRADEGMWPLEAFPSEIVAQKYGFQPSREWLDAVRLSSVRLAQGCSGSLVSDNGLVMTNHHCAHECIEQLSSARRDLVANGFTARTEKEELACPALEINRLVAVRDVTGSIAAATRNTAGQKYSEAKKAQQAKLERECATSDELRCEVVELYRGGQYRLYQYRRYQDVRLVFAPELAAAFFGGDPDNFNFPRYDLDLAFLRVYEGGKPARIDTHFDFSKQGAQAGELTFVSGHPGQTSRELTVAELRFTRDVRVPRMLLRLAELRGVLTEFQRRGPEQKRIASGILFSVENAFKAYRGRHQALLDATFFASKVSAEREFLARLGSAAPPQKKPTANDAPWRTIASALNVYREVYDRHDLLERGRGFDSELFRVARALVRSAAELPKPNEVRLREYSDAALPQLKQEVFSPAPIHQALEITLLTFSLTKLREILGADDPLVKSVLGKKAPATLASEFVKKSALANVALRKRLWEGGQTAVDASTDPMIILAKLVDVDARSVRKKYEDEIESVIAKAHTEIAKARFAVYGTTLYPDATFTLRLSYGAVQGWPERGAQVAPFTTFAGAFERHTGEDPFALPKSWLAARDRIALETRLNFVTTNDIIGGNSGSPVINKNAEIVGLIFDGNIHSLGGDYGFDARKNRAVAVHSSAILEALEKIYGAARIAHELRGEASAPETTRAP
jgi:hypothetical protein